MLLFQRRATFLQTAIGSLVVPLVGFQNYWSVSAARNTALDRSRASELFWAHAVVTKSARGETKCLTCAAHTCVHTTNFNCIMDEESKQSPSVRAPVYMCVCVCVYVSLLFLSVYIVYQDIFFVYQVKISSPKYGSSVKQILTPTPAQSECIVRRSHGLAEYKEKILPDKPHQCCPECKKVV